MITLVPDIDDRLPASSIGNYAFCPKQFEMMYLEDELEAENLQILQGRIIHENVHTHTKRHDEYNNLKITSINIFSDKYGIHGVADIVRLSRSGIEVIEYKKGYSDKGKAWRHDSIQLCTQAICLAEMFGKMPERGSIYYVSDKCKAPVAFTEELTNETILCINEAWKIITGESRAVAKYQPGCRKCNVYPHCLPELYEKLSSIDRIIGNGE